MVSMRSFDSKNYSPGTMVGSLLTYDSESFLNGPEEELSLGPDFFIFDEDHYTSPLTHNEEGMPYLSPITPQNWKKLGSSGQIQIDFTSFLERLDGSTDKLMMKLLARCFHEKITVFKNNIKIYNIKEEISNVNPTLENESGGDMLLGTRVIVSIDLENKFSPQLVRDFIEEADDLLDNREDLKIALRAVFPPTIAAAGYEDPIFSSPMARTNGRKQRKAARNNRISATIAALYGNDSEDYDSGREKRYRKRGRPRKSGFDYNNELNQFFSQEEKSKQRRSNKVNNGFDDEWKPEKKRHKAKSNRDHSDTKKVNKIKTPSDKAREEADLASMGLQKLEKHILNLQQQMRNVKHKHRKGTVCPRCTTEQRLKLAYKAKTRAQCEIKVQARTPVVPSVNEKQTVTPPPPVSKVESHVTPPVTRPKPTVTTSKERESEIRTRQATATLTAAIANQKEK